MVVLTLIILALLLGSCKTTKYVEVARVTHDTITLYRQKTDSVVLHDSIYHEVVSRHDTVFDTKFIERTRWRDRVLRDSIYIAKHDTVPKPYAVERKKTIAEKMRDKTWYILLAIAIVEALTIFALYKVWR